MYAYLMAVSASGTQRQDRDFYRGVPATGKAVCVADTSPPHTPLACDTPLVGRGICTTQTKRAGGGKKENGQKPGGTLTTVETQVRGVHTLLS